MNKVLKLLVCSSFLLLYVQLHANPADSVSSTTLFIRNWKVSGMQAAVDSVPVDTAHLNFQLDNHIDRFSISNAYRGNLGSPLQSKLYFDRPRSNEFIFAEYL